MKKRNVFLLGLLVVLLAMGLVLAGCGGDGSGDNTGGQNTGGNTGGNTDGSNNNSGPVLFRSELAYKGSEKAWWNYTSGVVSTYSINFRNTESGGWFNDYPLVSKTDNLGRTPSSFTVNYTNGPQKVVYYFDGNDLVITNRAELWAIDVGIYKKAP